MNTSDSQGGIVAAVENELIHELETELETTDIKRQKDIKHQKEAVEDRPVHRLEGILTMQQRTLEQAIAHRKEFEVTKNTNLAAMEASFREQIDLCDRNISRVTDALRQLQEEKQSLYATVEKRRQEIIEQFKADDEALMKIIKAQKMVIGALGDEGDGSRANGATRPNRGSDKKPETGQEEKRTN